MQSGKKQTEMDDIEDLIDWNLQYNIRLRDTLSGIDRLDLYGYFQTWFSLCYGHEC